MENCFLILELDPDTTDENVIKATIKKKDKEWSLTRNDEDVIIKRTAQENLKNLESIEKTLLDPDKRKVQATEAKKKISAIKQSKLADFESDILILRKGRISEKAIVRIVRKYKSYYYTEKDVRDLLKRKEHHTTSTAAPDLLDITIWTDIQKQLKLLTKLSDKNYENLYEFLEVDDDEKEITIIQNKIKELYKKLKPKEGSSTEANIKIDLQRHCKTIFADINSRKIYDNTLKYHEADPLFEMIETVCNTGSIEFGQLMLLLKSGQELKLEKSTIINFIKQKASKRKVPINVDLDNDVWQRITCCCGHTNVQFSDSCSKCGKKLFYLCSKCNKAVLVSSLQCSCGFSIKEKFEELSKVLRLFQRTLNVKEKKKFENLWEKSYNDFPKFVRIWNDFEAACLQKKTNDRKLESKLEKERIYKDNIREMQNAIKTNNKELILNLWDIMGASLQDEPLIKPYLKQIENAHRPEDITGITASHCGSYIQVSWERIPNVTSYTVTWSHKSHPLQIIKRNSLNITAFNYNTEGFRIEEPLSKPYYIKVFASRIFMNTLINSPGISPTCRTIVESQPEFTIFYKINYKYNLIGQKKEGIIKLSSKQDISNIPQLILVAKRGNGSPIDINNGERVKILSNICLKKNKEKEIRFKIDNLNSPSMLRLFIISEDDNQKFKLKSNFKDLKY